MTAKVKNISIVSGIIVGVILIYVFFIKSSSKEEAGLVSTSATGEVSSSANNSDSAISKEFLALLLNVKNIKLDDRIFADVAFGSLRDSSIVLVPDGTEGRPNPFAPIGLDVPSGAFAPATTPSIPTTPIIPPKVKIN